MPGHKNPRHHLQPSLPTLTWELVTQWLTLLLLSLGSLFPEDRESADLIDYYFDRSSMMSPTKTASTM